MTLQQSNTHAATTAATIVTKQYWTATEAAHILNDAHGLDALEFSPTMMQRKLAAAVAHRARSYNQGDQVLAIRDRVISQAHELEAGDDNTETTGDQSLPVLSYTTAELETNGNGETWQEMDNVT